MAYPNLKQSLWLLILYLLFSVGLGVPIAILGFFLDGALHENAYVIWFVALASFVLVAVYSKRRTDRTWRDILQFRPVSWQLYLPLGVSIIGLAIVGSDLGNLLRHLIPAPEIIVNGIKGTGGQGKSLWAGFLRHGDSGSPDRGSLIQRHYSRWPVGSQNAEPGHCLVRGPVRAVPCEPVAIPDRPDVGNCVCILGDSNRLPDSRDCGARAEQFSGIGGRASGTIRTD